MLFVHVGRHAHRLGVQRTRCFCSHTHAHVNCLFRKLGHANLGNFLNAVAVWHFLENDSEARAKRFRSSRLFFFGRPPGHSIPHRLVYSPLRDLQAAKPGNAPSEELFCISLFSFPRLPQLIKQRVQCNIRKLLHQSEADGLENDRNFYAEYL